jgi:SOUL heme-binding protein
MPMNKMKMARRMIWILIGIIILGGVLWGPIVSNVEQAQYKVIESQAKIEIRDYNPMIVAEATVSGDREEAINQGFRTIADYIFGNNQSSQNVAMTSPVIQQSRLRTY